MDKKVDKVDKKVDKVDRKWIRRWIRRWIRWIEISRGSRVQLPSIWRGPRGEFGATPLENVTSEKTTVDKVDRDFA